MTTLQPVSHEVWVRHTLAGVHVLFRALVWPMPAPEPALNVVNMQGTQLQLQQEPYTQAGCCRKSCCTSRSKRELTLLQSLQERNPQQEQEPQPCACKSWTPRLSLCSVLLLGELYTAPSRAPTMWLPAQPLSHSNVCCVAAELHCLSCRGAVPESQGVCVLPAVFRGVQLWAVEAAGGARGLLALCACVGCGGAMWSLWSGACMCGLWRSSVERVDCSSLHWVHVGCGGAVWS